MILGRGIVGKRRTGIEFSPIKWWKSVDIASELNHLKSFDNPLLYARVKCKS